LLGELYPGCGKPQEATARFESAEAATDSGQIAWAARAAKKTGRFDETHWRTQIQYALLEEQNNGSSLGAYNSAMLQNELGNKAAADAEFRRALLMADSKLAYHLSRIALTSEDK
jgi:hypothetical protein